LNQLHVLYSGVINGGSISTSSRNSPEPIDIKVVAAQKSHQNPSRHIERFDNPSDITKFHLVPLEATRMKPVIQYVTEIIYRSGISGGSRVLLSSR
jgi:hypothetical protein